MSGPSDTPRTDAIGNLPLTIADITPPFPVLARWEALARQLERELTATQEKLRLQTLLTEAAEGRIEALLSGMTRRKDDPRS